MIKCFFFFSVFFCATLTINAQKAIKPNYHPPLKIPLILASNFGELRPNHFHMGIDIKTKGKTGFRLYSIEDGFVSRIKVSPFGYGNVIYIDHPNGITSVYAHCLEFNEAIDSIVKSFQSKSEKFEVDLHFLKGDIPLKRGQIIGFSGNSGGSTAPHLHFELRNTESEHALNPLLFGFDIEDHQRPEIRGVKVYGLTKDGYRIKNRSLKRVVERGKTTNSISGEVIRIPFNYLSKTGGIGFAFDVIDRLDGASNKCGLYGSYLIIDGDTIFGQKTERVPFASTRYVNSHKDFQEYAILKKKFHKAFRTKENPLPIYINDNLGVFKPVPDKKYKAKYVAFDVKMNTSILEFDFIVEKGNLLKLLPEIRDSSLLMPSETKLVINGDVRVEFGRSTTYEPLSIRQKLIGSKIGVASVPVQNMYKIIINRKVAQDGSHYLKMTTAKGKTRFVNVMYDRDMLVFEPKYFGNYTLVRDTISPVITPIQFSKNSTVLNGEKLQWTIRDNATGIDDYDLFIDGKWVLLEYDGKKSRFTYRRKPSFKGVKSIRLVASDSCGNRQEWKTKLEFK